MAQEAQQVLIQEKQKSAEELEATKQQASSVIQSRDQDIAHIHASKLEMERRANEEREARVDMQRQFDKMKADLAADFDAKAQQSLQYLADQDLPGNNSMIQERPRMQQDFQVQADEIVRLQSELIKKPTLTLPSLSFEFWTKRRE